MIDDYLFFTRGSHHVFAQHDRLSAARRFSARRPGQSGGYPGDAGSHIGADTSARLDQKRIRRPLGSDSTSDRRYLYVNPRFYALRRNLFDQNRPSRRILRAELPHERTHHRAHARGRVSTLYLTQRFSALSGEGIVPYFSPASEVFGTRSLTIGDSYTFSGTRMSDDTQGVRDVVLAAAQAPRRLRRRHTRNLSFRSGGVETDVYALVGGDHAGRAERF